MKTLYVFFLKINLLHLGEWVYFPGELTPLFHFASLIYKGQLLKERICSSRSKFFPRRVTLFLDWLRFHGKQTGIPKKLFPFAKILGEKGSIRIHLNRNCRSHRVITGMNRNRNISFDDRLCYVQHQKRKRDLTDSQRNMKTGFTTLNETTYLYVCFVM